MNTEKPKQLLNDLESIREALDDMENPDGEDLNAVGEAAPAKPTDQDAIADELDQILDDEDVPVLEDIVDGGLEASDQADQPLEDADQGFEAGDGATQFDDQPGLKEDTIRALLDDEWADKAETIVRESRGALADYPGLLPDEDLPQPEDLIIESAHARAAVAGSIDQSEFAHTYGHIIDTWLHELVQANIDDLRNRILDAVQADLRARQSVQDPDQEGSP